MRSDAFTESPGSGGGENAEIVQTGFHPPGIGHVVRKTNRSSGGDTSREAAEK